MEGGGWGGGADQLVPRALLICPLQASEACAPQHPCCPGHHPQGTQLAGLLCTPKPGVLVRQRGGVGVTGQVPDQDGRGNKDGAPVHVTQGSVCGQQDGISTLRKWTWGSIAGLLRRGTGQWPENRLSDGKAGWAPGPCWAGLLLTAAGLSSWAVTVLILPPWACPKKESQMGASCTDIHVSWPWRLEGQDPGVGRPGSPRAWDAIPSLGPHTAVPLCVSVS